MELSKEGLEAMKANGVQMDDLSTFTEADVTDLFKTFNDRRYARKLLQNRQIPDQNTSFPGPTEIYTSNSSTDLDSTDDMDLDSVSHISYENEVRKDNASATKFTAREMLLKKDCRGKSNQAQCYFNGLTKDAANAANLWKTPPTSLLEISDKRRNKFFEVMEDQHPDLKNYRKEIWKRLGEHLMNRRKYLKDKISGKRKKCTSCKLKLRGESCEVSQNIEFDPGEEVYLLSKFGESSSDDKEDIVGKGLFISKKNDLFSNIVLKSKINGDLSTLQPALDDIKVKQMFEMRTSRLKRIKNVENKTGKKKKRTLPPLLIEDADHDQTDLPTLPALPAIDIDIPVSQLDVSVDTGAACSYELLNLSTIDDHHDTSSDIIPTTSTPRACRRDNKETEDSNFRSFCLMEWSGGNLYWGIKCVSVTDVVVQSTNKPSGRVNRSNNSCTFKRDDIKEKMKSVMKLSKNDLELNPDMRFCVWELPCENDYMFLRKEQICLKTEVAKHFTSILEKKLNDYCA